MVGLQDMGLNKGFTMSTFSIEVFPSNDTERLQDCVSRIAPLGPQFISVTSGAGGSTTDRTAGALELVGDFAKAPRAAHLTCVGRSRADVMAEAQAHKANGITRIVALRGDGFEAHPDGFAGSVDLTEALAEQGFDVSVGAYAERHPDSLGEDADLAHLQRKFEAGANRAITQFFFEADTFLRFRDRCVKAGIKSPIVPGILPIESWSGALKMATRCGIDVPAFLVEAFAHAERDDTTELLATSVAAEMCDDLLAEGVEHLHFYTLNRARLTSRVCTLLNLDGEPQGVSNAQLVSELRAS